MDETFGLKFIINFSSFGSQLLTFKLWHNLIAIISPFPFHTLEKLRNRSFFLFVIVGSQISNILLEENPLTRNIQHVVYSPCDPVVAIFISTTTWANTKYWTKAQPTFTFLIKLFQFIEKHKAVVAKRTVSGHVIPREFLEVRCLKPLVVPIHGSHHTWPRLFKHLWKRKTIMLLNFTP